MIERTEDDRSRAAPVCDALATVLRYHHETKHGFARFAPEPGALD